MNHISVTAGMKIVKTAAELIISNEFQFMKIKQTKSMFNERR